MIKSFICAIVSCCTAIVLLGPTVQGAENHTGPKVPAVATTVYYFDFSAAYDQDLKDERVRRRFYDEQVLLTCLQGLVNRERPRLFVRHLPEVDDFWWARMTESGSWLDGTEVKRIATLGELLELFAGQTGDLVVWDEHVPATRNVAVSVAGAENALPVRYDADPASLYQQLLTDKSPRRVKHRLVQADGTPLFTGEGTIPGTDLPSTGSPKNDAYRWLIERYVLPGKLNPRRVAYYEDGFWLRSWTSGPKNSWNTMSLDYFVASNAAVLDLGIWPDEVPIDDPKQRPGTDVQTLKAYLAAMNTRLPADQMIACTGFIPYNAKYTSFSFNGWHAGGTRSPGESEVVQNHILAAYNAYVDASGYTPGAMANGSFYRHYPLPDVTPMHKAGPSADTLKAAGILDEQGKIKPANYYAHYVGDYDASSWMYQYLPRFWADPKRGTVPLSWAFNPNLSDSFAFGMAYLRRTATPMDSFVGGSSGAGNLQPGMLVEPRRYSGYPSAAARWAAHCLRHFTQWGLSVEGFCINDFGPLTDELWRAYARFAPEGVVVLVPHDGRPHGVRDGVPYLVMTNNTCDYHDGQEKDVPRLVNAVRDQFKADGYTFHVHRTILCAPSYYARVDEEIAKVTSDRAVAVDVPTMLWLVREYATHPERYPSSKRFAAATEVRATSYESEGIAPRRTADGQFRTELVGATEAWVLPAGQALYLDVDDDFALSLGGGAVELEVTYLDRGTGDAIIDYDATGQGRAWTRLDADLRRTNGGAWVTRRVAVPDPLFGGRQHNSSDLRIGFPTGDGDGEQLIVRQVVVRKR